MVRHEEGLLISPDESGSAEQSSPQRSTTVGTVHDSYPSITQAAFETLLKLEHCESSIYSSYSGKNPLLMWQEHLKLLFNLQQSVPCFPCHLLNNENCLRIHQCLPGKANFVRR